MFLVLQFPSSKGTSSRSASSTTAVSTTPERRATTRPQEAEWLTAERGNSTLRLLGVAKHLHGARLVCAADNRDNGLSECDARLPTAQLPLPFALESPPQTSRDPSTIGLDARVLALNVLGVRSQLEYV